MRDGGILGLGLRYRRQILVRFVLHDVGLHTVQNGHIRLPHFVIVVEGLLIVFVGH